MKSPICLSRSQRVSFHHSPESYQLVQNDDTQISLAEFCKQCTPPHCSLSLFLFNCHLQTAWTQREEAKETIYYKRKIFESNHELYKGQFSVDFMVAPYVKDGTFSQAREGERLPAHTEMFKAGEDVRFLSEKDSSPILLVLHGMSGGSDEPYIRRVLAAISALDIQWTACVVNFRGCAQSQLTTGYLYNGRATWDFRQIANWLKQNFPNRPLFGVGFSIGANVLTNTDQDFQMRQYLGEEGEKCPLGAAVLVSNPWKLESASHALQRSWIGTEIYAKILGYNMRDIVERNIDVITQELPISRDSIQRIHYIQDFDREIQCPTWGYAVEDACYRDSSSADAMLAIRIPFLALQAEDDPISTKDAIPYSEFRTSPFGVLCTTPGGGHLGWFGAGDRRWFVKPITNFLSRIANSVNLEKSIEINQSLFTERRMNTLTKPRRFERAKL